MKIVKKIKLVIIILTAIIATIVLSYVGYSLVYSQKIYPNIKIAGLDVGGMTIAQAKKILQYEIDSVKGQEIILEYQEENWTISPKEWDVEYNLDQTINAVYQYGHSQSLKKNLADRIRLLFSPKEFQIAFSFNKIKLDELVEKLSDEINQPVKDASCIFINGKTIISSEEIGRQIQFETLKNQLINSIASVEENRKVILPVKTQTPKITQTQAIKAQTQAEEIIEKKIILVYEDQKIELPTKDITTWIEFIAVPNYNRKNLQYNLAVILNSQKVNGYVANLAKDINRDFKNAKLSISADRAVVFQKSQNGLELQQEKATREITETLLNSSKVAGITTNGGYQGNNTQSVRSLSLPVKTTKPEITEDDVDNLGIRELIGKGSTNFKGSPSNRVHNIKKGAELFNGVVVKPNEILSMLKILGPINAEGGFLPELVIKDNRTKPEYGGGLCQVSTTLFRAVLNAGLPVVERTNHSYRVSYYEPPVGMDATVYSPSPDFKFTNDTQNHILIQTKVENNEITFELYGTKDGREVVITDPEVYDYQSPGAAVYIETSDLPRGETKQIEKRHTGAKARFTYVVKRNGEEITNKTFLSYYKPWPARYLVGIGEPKPKPPENQPVENQEQSQQSSTQGQSSPPEQNSTTQNPSQIP